MNERGFKINHYFLDNDDLLYVQLVISGWADGMGGAAKLDIYHVRSYSAMRKTSIDVLSQRSDRVKRLFLSPNSIFTSDDLGIL
ncbi:hypothetical protein DVH26_11635 [Paenibacillus sp. H1-7]|nr:hypothetical protein DVH26_11635 [Paenibacillus sp. H1-7]